MGNSPQEARVDTELARVRKDTLHSLGAGREIQLHAGDLVEVYLFNGELYEARPRQRYSADGLVFPAGTRLRFQRDGRVSSALIVEPMVYQELLLPPGTELSFSRSGDLNWLQLTEATTIQAWPVEGIVSFHENGRVFRCRLSQSLNLAVPALSLMRGDRLALDSVGRLRELESDRIIDLGPIRAAAGEPIRFDEDGQLIEFCDAELRSTIRPQRIH